MNISITPPPPRLSANTFAPDLRPMSSQPVNLLRITTITLSLMLLVACGGGGGGGATPTAGGGGAGPQLQPLPSRLVANTDQTRNRVGGTAPPSLSSAEVGQMIRSIAEGADTLLYGIDEAAPVTCNGTSCTYTLDDGAEREPSTSVYSAQTIVEGEGVIGYNENNEAVMTDRGVTIVQRRVAGRFNTDEDGVASFTYQMYGGWNNDSHFGIEQIIRTGGSDTGTDIRTYSFGDASGSNPTTGTLINYTGVMIGTDTRTSQVVHGDAVIQFVVSNSAFLETVTFQNIVNLSNGAGVNIINFNNIPLAADGTFESDNGDIKGTFYGTGHEGIGGIFDKDNILGAFGAIQ